MLHLFYGIKPLLGLALLSIQVTCNLLGIPAHDSSSFHRTPLRGRDDSSCWCLRLRPTRNWTTRLLRCSNCLPRHRSIPDGLFETALIILGPEKIINSKLKSLITHEKPTLSFLYFHFPFSGGANHPASFTQRYHLFFVSIVARASDLPGCF